MVPWCTLAYQISRGGGVRIIGSWQWFNKMIIGVIGRGLEMVPYNNKRGVGIRAEGSKIFQNLISGGRERLFRN